MMQFELTRNVLGHTTFAYSPLAELTLSLQLLGNPNPARVHASWIRNSRNHVSNCHTTLLKAIAPTNKRFAPCLLPHPEKPRVSISEQLADLARTPGKVFERDMRRPWEGRPIPVSLEALLARGAFAPGILADVLWQYWESVFEPHWSRMRAVLEDDVAFRATTILERGLLASLNSLHPDMRVEADLLVINEPQYRSPTHAGDRLILVPSLFVWPKVLVDDKKSETLYVTYAARGVGRAWQRTGSETKTVDSRLAALLGRTRALVMQNTDAPITTTQLSSKLHHSLSSVNEHLSVLHDAGLVERWRSGRDVLYRHTLLGRSILAAQER